ncbi:MAG TPA: alpha/beta hydrolase [Terriglobia bacterium]|nr:alpha/beta hydrolase [Terriglobia bacterium]
MEISVGGHAVHVATGGQSLDIDKPAVLLLHGAGLDHSVWALQARYLAHHGQTVIAPDLPGHGRSHGAPLASIAELAKWSWDLLDTLGIDRCAVAGHSMGALIALHMAATKPTRLRALCLMAAAAAMPVHPDLLAAARDDLSRASALIAMWGFGPSGQVGGNTVPGVQMRLAGERLIERSRPGVLAADLAACNAYRNGTDDAAMIEAPAYLLLGAEDRMTPADKGRQLAAAMKNVRGGANVTILAGCGHMIMAERPDAATDALFAAAGNA